jgi:hypothetical protein
MFKYNVILYLCKQIRMLQCTIHLSRCVIFRRYNTSGNGNHINVYRQHTVLKVGYDVYTWLIGVSLYPFCMQQYIYKVKYSHVPHLSIICVVRYYIYKKRINEILGIQHAYNSKCIYLPYQTSYTGILTLFLFVA